ncbi:MAG: host cell division inhibitor Icd-like protein [Enterobacter roggenkampii]
MLATTPTQNPQFIWLIAAVRRDMPTITAKIHHIAAETEREARRTLARDHVCFFAGRKPLSVNKFSRAIKSAAREYRASYLTRSINGRAQTNVGINELAEEFIPRAYGSSTAEGGEE